MEQQRIDDLTIAEVEQPLSAVDQRHASSQRGEHDGVFQANHTATHHDQRTRNVLQVEQLIRIEDSFAIEGDVGRTSRLGPAGDEKLHHAVRILQHDVMRRNEPGIASINIDTVTVELILHDFHFVLNDLHDLTLQILHRDATLVAVAFTVNVALPVA